MKLSHKMSGGERRDISAYYWQKQHLHYLTNLIDESIDRNYRFTNPSDPLITRDDPITYEPRRSMNPSNVPWNYHGPTAPLPARLSAKGTSALLSKREASSAALNQTATVAAVLVPTSRAQSIEPGCKSSGCRSSWRLIHPEIPLPPPLSHSQIIWQGQGQYVLPLCIRP